MAICPSCGYPEMEKGASCGCTLAEKLAAIKPPAVKEDKTSLQKEGSPTILWIPTGPICLDCGADNPDKGDVCGGCGEKTAELPQGTFTKDQLIVYKLITESKSKPAD